MLHGVEFWSAHLSAITAEGISTKTYAQREGLSPASLYYWRKRLKPSAGAHVQTEGHESQVPSFVAVRVSEAAQAASCTLVIAPGVRLELAQLPAPAWLAAFSAAIQPQAR